MLFFYQKNYSIFFISFFGVQLIFLSLENWEIYMKFHIYLVSYRYYYSLKKNASTCDYQSTLIDLKNVIGSIIFPFMANANIDTTPVVFCIIYDIWCSFYLRQLYYLFQLVFNDNKQISVNTIVLNDTCCYDSCSLFC